MALNLACGPLSVVVGRRVLARDRPDPGLRKVIPSGQGTIGPLNFEPLNMIDDCPWTTRKPGKIEVGLANSGFRNCVRSFDIHIEDGSGPPRPVHSAFPLR